MPSEKTIARWLNPSKQKVVNRNNKSAIGQLLSVYRLEHRSLLLSGLEELRGKTLISGLVRCYEWKEEEPSKIPVERMMLQFELPKTLEVRCVLSHLGSEDTVVVGHTRYAEAYKEYRELCGDIYAELLETTQERARKLGVIWATGLEGPKVAILRGFVDSLYEEIQQIATVGLREGKIYQHALTYHVDVMRASLNFRGTPIAHGLVPKLDDVEAEFESVKALHTVTWRQYLRSDWIQRIAAARKHYEESVCEHNDALEIRARQPELLKGSCEICKDWGHI